MRDIRLPLLPGCGVQKRFSTQDIRDGEYNELPS